MSKETRSLCILVPCHNEALAVEGVVREFRAAFPEAKILVIDNASSDGTAEIAERAGAWVIKEPRKGKAMAVLTGLQSIETDAVIMVDGDGSYPAEGAKVLFDAYLEHPIDLLTGIRQVQHGKEAFRPMHQFGTRLFALCAYMVFGYLPGDVFSGLRLFSKRFYKNVPILSAGFELEMELTIQAVDKGFSVGERNVPFRERAEGSRSKLKTFRDGSRILRSLLLLFRDYKPLLFFGVISGIFLILGLAAGTPPVLEYYETRLVGRFPLAILAAALVNISIFTFLTGLVSQASLRYHREAFQIRLRNFKMTD